MAGAAEKRPGEEADGGDGDKLIVKVALLADPGVGKTSLMVRYVENKFDQSYNETLGVSWMEKVVKLPQAEVVMSIWDLGGSKSFLDLLPMVCVEAVAICFAFDLSDQSSLAGVKEWYRQARELNATALPFLVGTKFDKFYTMDKEEQASVTAQARRYAKAMRAPLVFTSSSYGINVQKLMKLVFCSVFQLPVSVKEKKKAGEPLLEYKKALLMQQEATAGGGAGAGPGAGSGAGAGTTGAEAADPGAGEGAAGKEGGGGDTPDPAAGDAAGAAAKGKAARGGAGGGSGGGEGDGGGT